MSDPRYPIGKFEKPTAVDPALRARCIEQIASTPTMVRAAIHGLDDAQLDTPYRAGGWTLRQVVHHLADSHVNAYIRFKLALTEDNPTIRPYEEALWAELPEARTGPIEMSLTLLEATHRRWLAAIRSTPVAMLARPYVHPVNGPFHLDQLLALYAWHGRHHAMHITGLRKARNW